MMYNKKQRQIIFNALKEYENNHYEGENDEWQKIINDLIQKFNDK